MDRLGTAWGVMRSLDNGDHGARVLERMDKIAPWVLVAVAGREVRICLSSGGRIEHVSIETTNAFMDWAHVELSRLEGPAVGASRNLMDRAVDCCARYVIRKIMDASNPGVGGVVFTSWPPDDWPAYQAGFIAGHHAGDNK